MALDQFFLDLESRILELEKKFLTAQLKSEEAEPMTYTPDLDFLAAYRVLAHAEVEDFFERKARSVLDKLGHEIQVANPYKPNLLIYILANHFNIHIPHDGPYNNEGCRTAAKEVINCCNDFLIKNNGIKTATFVTISLICGKSIDDVDSFLCSALSSFGESRGDVAHKSASRIRTIMAPSAEKKAVSDIVLALREYFYPGCSSSGNS